MKNIDFSKYTRSEVLSIARLLNSFELELKYYHKQISVICPSNTLFLRRIEFLLGEIFLIYRKIYELYKDDEYKNVFISLIGFYD